MSRAAVFLDRDGVLVEEIFYPHTGEREAPLAPQDVRLLPGTGDALRHLARVGYFLVLVSNQGAHAKGKAELGTLWRVHDKFVDLLTHEYVRLDEYYYSWSHPQGTTAYFSGSSLERKPNPYFLMLAAARYDLDLAQSWMVGDRDTDVACGRAAGVRTIRVGASSQRVAGSAHPPDFQAAGLSQAVEIITRKQRGPGFDAG